MDTQNSGPEVDPATVASALYGFGYGMLEQERWCDGADVFRAMVLACPTDERAWLGLGKCHEELGETQVAIDLYAFGCAAIPSAVRCRVALARVFRAAARYQDADEALDMAQRVADELEDESAQALVADERRAS